MKQLLTTNGRVSRSTFWAFFGPMFGFFAFLGGIQKNVKLPEWAQTVIGLSVFPLLLVGLIVQIKRWHDLNKSGWWVFINLIPFIGGLWTLIECGCVKGTEGSNQFGPDPLAPKPPPLPVNERSA